MVLVQLQFVPRVDHLHHGAVFLLHLLQTDESHRIRTTTALKESLDLFQQDQILIWFSSCLLKRKFQMTEIFKTLLLFHSALLSVYSRELVVFNYENIVMTAELRQLLPEQSLKFT